MDSRIRARNEYQRLYRKKNNKVLLEKKKEYFIKNREQLLAYKKGYREANREKIAASNKIYRDKNRKAVRARNTEYYSRNVSRKRAYDSRQRFINKYFPNWYLEHLKKQEDRFIIKLNEATAKQDVGEHMFVLEALRFIWTYRNNEVNNERCHPATDKYDELKQRQHQQHINSVIKAIDYFPYVKTLDEYRDNYVKINRKRSMYMTHIKNNQ